MHSMFCSQSRPNRGIAHLITNHAPGAKRPAAPCICARGRNSRICRALTHRTAARAVPRPGAAFAHIRSAFCRRPAICTLNSGRGRLCQAALPGTAAAIGTAAEHSGSGSVHSRCGQGDGQRSPQAPRKFAQCIELMADFAIQSLSTEAPSVRLERSCGKSPPSQCRRLWGREPPWHEFKSPVQGDASVSRSAARHGALRGRPADPLAWPALAWFWPGLSLVLLWPCRVPGIGSASPRRRGAGGFGCPVFRLLDSLSVPSLYAALATGRIRRL